MPTIDLSGDEALLRQLERVGDFNALRPVMVRAVSRVRAEIAPYPPPPPDSTYVRTGRLGRSWTDEVHASPDEVRGIIGNNVVYAPYVQASGNVAVRGVIIQGQAAVHRGRWMTDQEALDHQEENIRRDFERELESMVGE